MKTKTKAILRRLVLVVLGVLLGLSVYARNAKNVVGNQMPMPFGLGLAVVQSGSMEPTFSKGDLLLVKEQDAYAVGDIVVYQSEGILIVHRIVATDGETVTTQGDANNVADPSFNNAAIKGAVVGHVPSVGCAVDFLKTPFGIILLLACAIVLEELSFRKEKQQADQDEKSQRIRRLQKEIELLRQELDEPDEHK